MERIEWWQRRAHGGVVWRRQSGQGTVEFALVLPVFLLLLLVVLDVARGMYAYVALTNAARLGGRAAAIYLEGQEATSSQAPTQAEWNALLAAVVQTASPSLSIVSVDTSTTARTSTDGGNVVSVYNGSFIVDGLPTIYDTGTGSYDLTSVRVSIHYTFYPLVTSLFPVLGLPMRVTSTTSYPLY